MNKKVKTSKSYKSNVKSVLEMTHKEAFEFFTESESYCSIELPHYFTFNKILSELKKYDFSLIDNLNSSNKIYKTQIKRIHKVKRLENINYVLYSNKDARYNWRPFEIIHPVLYVDLVRQITSEENWKSLISRFLEFQKIQISFV